MSREGEVSYTQCLKFITKFEGSRFFATNVKVQTQLEREIKQAMDTLSRNTM